jgi:hypothetical protein
MDIKKAALGAILTAMLIATAQAVRVGVVVTFPDGNTYTQCISIAENASAYEIMRETAIPTGWSSDPMWGHGLCSINNTGCPEDNCYCTSDYWGFYISTSGTWQYSPVGFDAGESCWNGDWNSWDGHYCAKEGQLIGFAYGPYGTKPKTSSFSSACQEGTGSLGNGGSGLFNMELNITKDIHKNSQIEIMVFDIKRNRTVRKAHVIVYDNNAGTKRLYDGLTNENGQTSFKINKTGEYNLEIRAHDYNNLNRIIDVLDETTTTMETTTTQETTTTIKTTTTTMLPHILIKTRTTTSKATTTMETAATSTTLEGDNKITGMAIALVNGNGGLQLMMFGLLAALSIAYLILRR